MKAMNQILIQQLKWQQSFQESLKKQWETKVMHGQYVRSIDRQLSSE
jgi:hypothetical protein